MDPARKKCPDFPVTEPTIIKPLVSVRFACARLQVALSAINLPDKKINPFAERRLSVT
jgi:hypothetical protein